MIQVLLLPLGPLQTNCYIVACEQSGKVAVIDPSWSGRAIAATVDEQGWELTHILVTHSHFDHVGGLAHLKQAVGAPIYIHADAVPMLQEASMTAAMMGGMQIPAPPPPDKLVNEGDVIEVGKLKFQVLLTPGHAPGHISFHLPDHRVIFSGDVLFQGSIGRTDLPGCDHDLLMNVIKTKFLTLPGETRVFSGHGDPTTIGDERDSNPFLQSLTASDDWPDDEARDWFGMAEDQ